MGTSYCIKKDENSNSLTTAHRFGIIGYALCRLFFGVYWVFARVIAVGMLRSYRFGSSGEDVDRHVME